LVNSRRFAAGFGVIAVVAVVAVAVFVATRPAAQATPGASVGAVESPAAGHSPSTAALSPSPGSSQGSSAAPSDAAAPEEAIVPIVGYWSMDRMITSAELRLALTGKDPKFRKVLVASPDRAAVVAALGVQVAGSVMELSPTAVVAAVEGHTNVLGILRAEDVRPAIRALGIDGRVMFGDGRVRRVADWALTIRAPRQLGGTTAAPFDASTTWTVVAAGDVMNDRAVYQQAVVLHHGPDFPWNGGTAKIVGRSCCVAGDTTVRAAATGNAGAVAALFRDADLALVNHEGPTPNNFSYHPLTYPSALTFSFDPALEAGIHDAGVDIVSLANNHIRNYGSLGVTQTIANVKAAGVTPIGAGRNLAAANAPAWFAIDGVRVAILAFDAIDLGSNAATASRPGAAPLDLTRAKADIKAARAGGAQVVIVIPHWGVEYTSAATTSQRRDAAALIADGADVILGSHPHWAGAMEAIGKGVVVYSMGDFIFDLPRSEKTDEGLIVELTFVGTHLAQIDIHPTIELNRSQPNLLDPADGQVVLERIRAASSAFLHW
jgi:poly-gamma-glutamate capsule biosynthesis protein CapA/YwtB (metallophosphatase superfamily)